MFCSIHVKTCMSILFFLFSFAISSTRCRMKIGRPTTLDGWYTIWDRVWWQNLKCLRPNSNCEIAEKNEKKKCVIIGCDQSLRIGPFISVFVYFLKHLFLLLLHLHSQWKENDHQWHNIYFCFFFLLIFVLKKEELFIYLRTIRFKLTGKWTNELNNVWWKNKKKKNTTITFRACEELQIKSSNELNSSEKKLHFHLAWIFFLLIWWLYTHEYCFKYQ